MQDRYDSYEQRILEEEDVESTQELLPLQSFLSPVYSKPVSKPARTKEQALADEISKLWGNAISFPRLMKIISTKGYQFVFETFKEVKQPGVRNPVALFLWKIKTCKVDLKEIP